MNKRYTYLILCVLFFFASIYVFTFLHFPDASSGSTSNLPYVNCLVACAGIILMSTSVAFFTVYFRGLGGLKTIGVIPVRMASSRFPGKPLAKINGKPMLQHIYESCKKCKSLDELYVATPDKEIIDFCDTIKAKCILTSKEHERASDRVEEAVERLESFNKKYDIIVMIQGDEPLVTPEMIDKAIEPLLISDVQVTNLMGYIETKKEAKDKNTIKVVTDKHHNALYFSRSQIPHDMVGYKQVCIIAFTKQALTQFSMLEPTILEQVESIDMLRFIDHGIPVKMVLTKTQTHAVDVPHDIKIVEKLIKK